MPPIIMQVRMVNGSNWNDPMTFPDSSTIFSAVTAPSAQAFTQPGTERPVSNISGTQHWTVRNNLLKREVDRSAIF